MESLPIFPPQHRTPTRPRRRSARSRRSSENRLPGSFPRGEAMTRTRTPARRRGPRRRSTKTRKPGDEVRRRYHRRRRRVRVLHRCRRSHTPRATWPLPHSSTSLCLASYPPRCNYISRFAVGLSSTRIYSRSYIEKERETKKKKKKKKRRRRRRREKKNVPTCNVQSTRGGWGVRMGR